MPAVQTTYSTTMQAGLEGMIATQLDDDMVETRICETSAGIAFGRAVSEGANARGAVLGGATKFIGITVRSITEVPIYPNVTLDLYVQKTNMGVMIEGDIWVRPAAAVTHGSPATYSSTTGQLNPRAAGVAIAGSRYLTSCGAGELAILRLTSAAPARNPSTQRIRTKEKAMNYHSGFMDAQSALTFMQQQASYIEPQVYETQYPDIQYPDLVPVDTSGNEWAKSKTFYSSDKVGQAQWFHHMANDIPFADIVRTKFEVGMEMAGIGYYYTLEELGVAMQVPNMNLTAERGDAARRAYEEFMERIAFTGDTAKGWTGLINDTVVTAGNATADGTGTSSLWSTKSGDLMARDMNAVISGIYTTSNTIEMADTLLLPIANFTLLANTRMENTTMNALGWIQQFNTYTAITGNQLTIRAVRGLETAGAGGTARMVAYKNDPQILKLHLPMPHKLLGVMQVTALRYDVPGIFRTGELEIRPGSVRYLDNI